MEIDTKDKQENSRNTGPERRKFIRTPLSFHVYFTPCGLDKNKLVPGGFPDYSCCNNISIDGMQLNLHYKPKIGEYLRIQLTLQDSINSQIINVLGQLAWFQYDETKENYTAGIEFVALEDIDREKINNFIKETLKDHYGHE
jgi:hypothetical protein